MTFYLRILFVLALTGVSCCAYSSSLRISPEELNKSLKHNSLHNSLIILDARSADDYKKNHITGALNFPVELTYENKHLNGKITSPLEMQKIFRSLGLHKNIPVIVYDDGDLADAARLFWVLEVYGMQQVRVLDHGYDHWLKNNYPVSKDIPEITPSSYIASINHKRLSSKFITLLATKNTNQLIIDARPREAYIGKISTAKRFGHIPTAINVPASHNIVQDDGFSSLKQLSDLSTLYRDIPRDKKVIIYCALGRVSATNYLALRELGYDVSNYDASWKEWGNDFKLPIEK